MTGREERARGAGARIYVLCSFVLVRILFVVVVRRLCRGAAARAQPSDDRTFLKEHAMRTDTRLTFLIPIYGLFVVASYS